MRSNGFLIVLLGAMALVVAFLTFGGDGPIAGLQRDDFASVGYLAILGAVLAASVLAGSRADLPAALRSAVVWIAVFAGLVGLYAYRDEFRELGDRVVAELVPGRPIAVVDGDRTSVMVRRGLDQHFHVAAEVDGQSVDFLVDTGASHVALDRRTAARLGFEPADLDFRQVVQTANGLARSAPIVLPSIRIGGIERRNVRAAVMDRGGDGTNLLGMSFLGTLSSFGFQGPSLILTD